MDMGHLYHDSHFTSMAIELAVKEKLRTREMNAREDRALEVTSQGYNRAKVICEKNGTFEKWRVGQSLKRIKQRTPALDNSLAVEKARVDALQRALLARGYVQGATSPSTTPDTEFTHSGPPPGAGTMTDGTAKKDQRRSPRQKRIVSRERPLNTELSRDLLRQADYIRRSEHTVKALARLRWRQDKRRLDHRRCKEELMAFSKPLIERARVILKGRDDLDVSQFLAEFERFIIGSDRLTTTKTDSSYTSHESCPTSPFNEATLGAVNEGRLDRGHQSDQEDLSVPAVPVKPEVPTTTLVDSKLGFVTHKRLFPEVNQYIPIPPITSLAKAEPAQDASLEAESTNQSKEETVSREAAELHAANDVMSAGDLKVTENELSVNSSVVRDRRKQWSSGPVEAVWLPQLWKQHKRKVLNVGTVPAMKHVRRLALQRM